MLAIDYGRLPWIALILAFSFGTYGLLKKTIDMGALESLSVETTLLFLPAMGFLVYLNIDGTSALQEEGMGQAALLAYDWACYRHPAAFLRCSCHSDPAELDRVASVLAPVIQFLIGVVIYNESMPASRWIGFSLVWVALVVLAHRRRRGSPTREID